jgi:type I restriction enzyme S subunit
MTELGPLPEEWQVVRLEDVVSLGSEAVNPTHVAAGRYVGLEHIEPGSTRIQKWGHPSEVRSLKTAFRPGDVLYGKLRPYLDKAALAEWEGICSTDILVLRAQNGLEPDFLAYLAHTRTFLEYAIATMTGVNHPRTSWKALQQLQVPLPPLPEQRAIAHVLRTVQRVKEATEGVIAALRELKKSLMQHLFTYGPVPVTERERVPLQETEIGPLPAHWRVVRLGEVAETTSGGTPSREVPEFFGGTIPWVKSGELNDTLVTRTEETITEDGLRNSNAKIFQKGTLLIAMYGATAGKVGILAIPATTNQAICAILPDTSLALQDFLFYALIRQRETLLSQRYGGAQPNLNQTIIRSFPIPLPPLDEQREIARILQAVDAKIAAEERRRAALEEVFKTLLHQLMTGKVRVKGFHLPELEWTP